MTLQEFQSLIAANPSGVVLLEGKRKIPQEDAIRATALAVNLTSAYPQLRFRSGNAPGSDEAFSEGVTQVDPSRLEIVAPYEGHRKAYRFEGASYSAPSNVMAAEEEALAEKTISATPRNNRSSKNGPPAVALLPRQPISSAIPSRSLEIQTFSKYPSAPSSM